MRSKSAIIGDICSALAAGKRDDASSLAKTEYPFTAFPRSRRAYSALEALRVFRRDGFVDRYSGERLIFPGTLRLLSRILPDEFPMHPNWKISESHLVFWELFPTIDHLKPVARGGADEEPNWITTSMARNSAKANFTVEELGWQVLPAGSLSVWDGLTGWFLDFVREHPSHVTDEYVRRWHRAAVRAEKPNKAPEPTPGSVTPRATE